MSIRSIAIPLCAAGVILAGAGCAFTQSTSRNVQSEATPVRLSEHSPNTNSNVDTSSWKTYTNDLCRFTLKYPKDAIVVQSSKDNVTITTQEDLDFQKNQEGEVPSAYYVGASCKNLNALIAENGSNFIGDSKSITTLDGFFSNNTSNTIQKIDSVNIGGQSAIAAHIGASQWYSLWIDRGNIAVIDFSYAQTAEELSPVQQAILASIVFTK